MGGYTKAVCAVAGILSAKQMCVHLLTIRSRLVGGVIDMPPFKPLVPMFRLMFNIRGKATDEEKEASNALAERANSTTGNNAQNEPFFILAAAALAPFVESGSLATTLLGVYVLSRIAHNYAFIADTQPMRAMTYSCGLFINIGFAVVAITAALGS